MKIKIKSREEIEKTLNGCNHKDRTSCYFNRDMFLLCGHTLEAKESPDAMFNLYTEDGDWFWHEDWYEVVEPDFTKEDLMDIELMNEMLAYFLEGRWD